MKGLVLVHGRGGSARDMLSLVGPLGAGELAVAAPEAPGRSWWPTSFLAPMAQMEAPLAAGLEAVDGAMTSLGLPRDQIAVLGFSQGACLALEYGARHGAGLGAVIGLSGGLVGSGDGAGALQDALYGHADKRFDYAGDLAGLPVLVTCHSQDPHIPIKRARDSIKVFGGLNARATLIEHPGPGHQPMPDGISAARALLRPAE